MTESGPPDLVGKRIRVKAHPQAPAALVGREGLVLEFRKLEPDDDDVCRVRFDNGDDGFVPVDALEVVA